MSLSAKDFNLRHLGILQVSYPPKNIYTEAIQVTPANIGAISLELQTTLRYLPNSQPFIMLDVLRDIDGDSSKSLEVVARPTDWLVALREELHVFKDFDFHSTFHIAAGGHHELADDHGPLTSVDQLEARRDELMSEDSANRLFTPEALQ